MNIYNIGNIYKLLTLGFSVADLDVIYFDIPDFQEFQTGEKRLNGLSQEIIKYAERRVLMEELLEWAKSKNPKRYERHKPYKVPEEAERTARNLKRFFHLDKHNLEITIYLSRHSAAAAELVLFTNVYGSDANKAQILKKIQDYQEHEEQSPIISPNEFAVVSAMEMLEALHLKNEIENASAVEVKLKVCPEPKFYEEFLNKGTTIFVGGPRANLGAYYYLYGYESEAGVVRPKREPKNIIECINNPELLLDCNENHNLAIIQKHKIIDGDKTIFFLAGTGVSGTSAAVAYIRQKWLDLLDAHGEDNFFRIIEVSGGKMRQDDLTSYDLKWIEKEPPCREDAIKK